MSDYGLTEYGLQIPSYEDWRDQYFNNAKNTFGTELNIGTSSIAGQLFSLFAYQDMQIWDALLATYDSQTVNGAEGIYLDEILSRRGIFRKSAAYGTGFAYLQTNSSAQWTYTVPTTTYISASNGQNYQVSTATALRDRVAAFKVTRTELVAAGPTIMFSISNADSGAIKTKTITTSSQTALADLLAFITQNISQSETNKAFIENNTLYLGFTSPAATNTKPVGLTSTVKLYATANLGTKWSLIPVTATVTGVYYVYSGEVTSITPTPPNGYISVGNFTEFYEGRQVETDAEYRVRYNDTVDEANAATRPAIFKAISDLDGVQRVRIYDNPTRVDTPETPALTFNTVVFGGNTQEIAETLYEKKPINTLTYGTVSYIVSLPDGGTEIIRYTPATEESYSIKINYRTVNDQPLTEEEMQSIKDNLIVLAASFNIGAKIFNAQLQGIVYSSVTFGRFSYISVQTKLASEDDSGYNTNDIDTNFFSIANILEENILFEQVV